MAVRVIFELVGILAVAAVLLALGRSLLVRPAGSVPELDVAMTPSTWFTDSRTTDDGRTEVCIIRVEKKTGVVRERRVLRLLDNAAPGYSEALDQAMDEAYAAMRVANVNLNRR